MKYLNNSVAYPIKFLFIKMGRHILLLIQLENVSKNKAIANKMILKQTGMNETRNISKSQNMTEENCILDNRSV